LWQTNLSLKPFRGLYHKNVKVNINISEGKE